MLTENPGGIPMLGIASLELAWAYLLCLFAALLCLVFGLLKWKSGS
jgi:hypothetical protein